MTGLSNYTANNLLNWIGGGIAEPSLPSVWIALFTAVGTDAGTGFTEVAGNGYARVQIAGTDTVNAATNSTSNVLNFAAVIPTWIQPGMYVYDSTTAAHVTVGTTVVSTLANTITMSATPVSNIGTTDVMVFSSFTPPTGTAPASSNNNSTITFAQATGNWGTIVAFGLYDNATSGNLLVWDFLGNYNWLPFSATSVGSGAGGVFTAKAHGYAAGDPLVVTAEYGGTLPTASQGTLTSYTQNYANTVLTDSVTLSANGTLADQGTANAVWTSATGDGMIRKIVQQSIPQNVTAAFSNGTLVVTAS